MTSIRIVLAVAVAFLVTFQSAFADSTPAASASAHPSCSDLATYTQRVIAGTFYELDESHQQIIRDFIDGEIDPETARPSQLRKASEAFDDWATLLDETDDDVIPFAARDYHALLVNHLSVVASLLNAVASSGPLAIFGYADQAEELPAAWERVDQEGLQLCGEAWAVMGDELQVPSEREEQGSQSNRSSTSFWDTSDIVEHMGLRPTRSGIAWTFRTSDGTVCDVAVVLTSAAQVRLYANAGDAVATNPEGTAGVKIVGGNKRTCLEAATELLEDLE